MQEHPLIGDERVTATSQEEGPKCGSVYSWKINGTVFECKDCYHQSTVIAGTIFQDTHKPLTLWFQAIWYVTSQKNGISALGLQRILGLGSYRTAWTWLHKLRRAMIRPVVIYTQCAQESSTF